MSTSPIWRAPPASRSASAAVRSRFMDDAPAPAERQFAGARLGRFELGFDRAGGSFQLAERRGFSRKGLARPVETGGGVERDHDAVRNLHRHDAVVRDAALVQQLTV